MVEYKKSWGIKEFWNSLEVHVQIYFIVWKIVPFFSDKFKKLKNKFASFSIIHWIARAERKPDTI